MCCALSRYEHILMTGQTHVHGHIPRMRMHVANAPQVHVQHVCPRAIVSRHLRLFVSWYRIHTHALRACVCTHVSICTYQYIDEFIFMFIEAGVHIFTAARLAQGPQTEYGDDVEFSIGHVDECTTHSQRTTKQYPCDPPMW